MSNRILFVFEGEKTEKQIFKNLSKHLIDGSTIVCCAFCTDIYQLHKEISDDEDLDTFVLLKGKGQNARLLSAFKREDFAEIYMFFDYDGHAPLADDKKIEEVLTFFDDETLHGKLFISYPMVEALKHNPISIKFELLTVAAKNNINYKKMVHLSCNSTQRDLTSYTKDIWIGLIDLHLKKMNYIVYGINSLPTKSILQKEIFKNQTDKYIKINSTVAVLSAFPIFIFDYYGSEYVINLLAK